MVTPVASQHEAGAPPGLSGLNNQGQVTFPLYRTILYLFYCRFGHNGGQFGLTAYGEPCTDTCKQRGFPYAWCHKKPSWNGTYLSKWTELIFYPDILFQLCKILFIHFCHSWSCILISSGDSNFVLTSHGRPYGRHYGVIPKHFWITEQKVLMKWIKCF